MGVPENRERSKHLTISNDIADLAIVRDGLGRFCGEHDISRKTLMQLQVTLDELITNVIKYAWPGGGKHELSVRMTATAQDLRIELVDDGQPFDPRTAPPPPKGSAQRRQPGGIGLHMVKQLVDDIQYWRRNGRNHIGLTKRLKPGDRSRGV